MTNIKKLQQWSEKYACGIISTSFDHSKEIEQKALRALSTELKALGYGLSIISNFRFENEE